MSDSMENSRLVPCPLLPPAPASMSWRDLHLAKAMGSVHLFEAALCYTQFLWLKNKPARAILALCRAIYLDPSGLPESLRQPYAAYTWILRNHRGDSFIGNPRISFLHQATRIRGQQELKRARAWALWHLTGFHLPHLPGNPGKLDTVPEIDNLARFLDRHGLPHEGAAFLEAIRVTGE